MTMELEAGRDEPRGTIRTGLSPGLMDDLRHSVLTAWKREGVVNVPVLAELVHTRYLGEVATARDLEEHVVAAALTIDAVMFFDSHPERART